MTTGSKASIKLLTSSLPFPRESGNPCLKPLFWHSKKVGAVCRPPNDHPPTWRVTISTTESSRCQELFRTPVNQASFNTHSSRSGSVQRILSAVPAPGFSHSMDFFGAGTTDRMLFIIGNNEAAGAADAARGVISAGCHRSSSVWIR